MEKVTVNVEYWFVRLFIRFKQNVATIMQFLSDHTFIITCLLKLATFLQTSKYKVHELVKICFHCKTLSTLL